MNGNQIPQFEREQYEGGDQSNESPSVRKLQPFSFNRIPNSFMSDNQRESQSLTQTLLDSTIKDSIILDFWDIDDMEQLAGSLSGDISKISSTKFTIKVINSSFIYGTILLPFFFQSCGILLTLFFFFFLFALSFYTCSILLKIKQIAKQEYQIGTFLSMIKLLKISSIVVLTFRGVYMLNCILYLIFLQNIFGRTMQYFFFFLLNYENVQTMSLLNPQIPFQLSIRFFTIMGSILIIPLIFTVKSHQNFTAIGRLIGYSALLFGAYGSFIFACIENKIQITNFLTPPPQFSIVNMFSSLPSIVLAFAYHQQFFTTSYRIEDADFKMSMASFQGSIIILTFELSIAFLGGIAFYNSINSTSTDLITLIMEGTFIDTPFKLFILIQLFLSTWMQQLQYIRQCSRQYYNIRMIYSKQHDSSRPQSIISKQHGIAQFVILISSTGLAMAVFQPYIPLVLMGALTQLFLSLMVPSILFLRYKYLEKLMRDSEAIITTIVLIITILLSFVCLFCVILAIHKAENE